MKKRKQNLMWRFSEAGEGREDGGMLSMWQVDSVQYHTIEDSVRQMKI